MVGAFYGRFQADEDSSDFESLIDDLLTRDPDIYHTSDLVRSTYTLPVYLSIHIAGNGRTINSNLQRLSHDKMPSSIVPRAFPHPSI